MLRNNSNWHMDSNLQSTLSGVIRHYSMPITRGRQSYLNNIIYNDYVWYLSTPEAPFTNIV